MIPSPRLAACVSIVEVALARPLRVRDELTGAVYVRRGAQGELPRHHRRDGEKQADVSGFLLVVAAVGPLLSCTQVATPGISSDSGTARLALTAY